MRHLNRSKLSHDDIDLSMLHSTVGFRPPYADSGRFCLALGYRNFSPTEPSQIGYLRSGFWPPHNVAARWIGIVAPNSISAERQIPIASRFAPPVSVSSRGFLPWGLCDACPLNSVGS